jgi:uncharacterized protein YcaQ
VGVHQLSQAEARRIAIRAQLLDEPRPTDVIEVLRHLGAVNLDPTAAIAPAADLILWSRLGSTYDTDDLRMALEHHVVVDHRGVVRPSEDMALYRAQMAVWPGVGELKEWQYEVRDWVEANDACRRDILHRLEESGPLAAREIPDTCVVAWKSSGWNNDRNVLMLLERMVARGEVAVNGRRGRDRLWDLAERVYPDDPVPDLEEAKRLRRAIRLEALGIARATGTVMPGEPQTVGDAGEPAEVEGIAGEWRVEPALLDGAGFSGRAALLSPFDRLVQDRKRLTDLFDYEYYLEMYKPAAKRRWGYFALPILYDDRLVGKLDAKADRKAGVLTVFAIHQDTPFDKRVEEAVDAEIDDLARWLDVELRFAAA